ncbi:MAG: AMP-binding protein [Aurantimonas endophytica]|uniref:Acetyl-CoA synthetase n=1 Tax=Aurantimonas endophytica TaxID=1522175 RepID=A0A7W6HHW8_9HYPH|nr:AMP-binding protein [Aurantimonas endophytica]MBB4005514.1 acetyl-CoA synthetase [Aurantimonas endophytica]MCO6406511.1 AMP-binding protein [Aurantimonas endophytica]
MTQHLASGAFAATPWNDVALPAGSYEALRAGFAWRLPERFNLAASCADDWAAREPDRVCLIEDRGDAPPRTLTYGELARRSRGLAAGLARHGIRRGDRIAIVLPQGFEAAVAHLAVYRMGAIAVPLSQRFGPDALGFRLKAAGARVAVVDAASLVTLRAVTADLPELDQIVGVEAPEPGLLDFAQLVREGDGAEPAATRPDDPAMIIFTSGTTGPPKGALHGHRVLIGHLPGMRFHHEGFPVAGDRLWTPSDWAWAGGLLNALLPSLYFGVPVVFSGGRFDAGEAFELMARQRVRNAFLPATALRMLKAAATPDAIAGLALRTIGSAGETLPRDTFHWAATELGLTVNEFYGQTECNMVLGSSARYGVSRAGAIGKAVPGHHVAILGEDGRELAPGETGTIAVAAPDPVMFLGYWQDPEASRRKVPDGWLLTGDQGVMDADGYVRFVGRDDDVITSAGYRIGPGEVEDCLLAHPAVKLAAVVGKPDRLRTEIVKAYVVPADGVVADEKLAAAIQLFVRQRLSAHEYPREVAFVSEMPLTTSGKIIRREFRNRALAEAEAAALD